jgi:hypothetical protein
MNQTKVWHVQMGRAQRLHQLGLTEAELLTAVEHGQAAAANCTENNPCLQRSIDAWGGTIRSLREIKILRGWTRHDEKHQQPLVLNPKGDMAITTAAGDEYTGNKDRNPATKSSKGLLTELAVKSNSLKYTMFGDIRKPNTRETWILLFYRDQDTLEIRSELSLPVDMNAEKQVDHWLERIILSTIPFNGTRETLSDDKPQSPEIDVQVKRRA